MTIFKFDDDDLPALNSYTPFELSYPGEPPSAEQLIEWFFSFSHALGFNEQMMLRYMQWAIEERTCDSDSCEK
jgi:hypothetical protein